MNHPTSLLSSVGVVGLAYGGYNLGEELGPGKPAEMCQRLAAAPVTVHTATPFVLTETNARAAGAELARAEVDCILAVITTFVPDTFIVELLEACDKPIFLWCVEREMQCISVVCAPLITATLHNLGKQYQVVGADIPAQDSRLGTRDLRPAPRLRPHPSRITFHASRFSPRSTRFSPLPGRRCWCGCCGVRASATWAAAVPSC